MVEGYGVCLENLAGWSLLELLESGISSMPAMWFRLEQLEGSASALPRWTCLESWLNTANFAAGWTPIDSRAASLSSITFWRTLDTDSGEVGSPPAPPTLILPENASTTTPTPTFQWGATSPLDNFRLEVDNDSDFSSPEDNLTFDRNVTSWTKPAPGYAVDNYYWRVWAVNSFGESCSIVRTFRVLLGPPTQPALLSPENGSTTWTVITLAWRRAERADNHRIEISTDPDFRALVENTYLQPPNDNSYTALLSGPGVYYWRVWGVNPLGENCSEVWSFRAYLAAPSLLSPADGSNMNIQPTLIWENLTPVDNFELQVDNAQDFSSPEVRVNLTETSYTVSLPDGLYYWRVKAFRWGENSPWSSIRTFRIDTVPPSKPTLLFPVNISTNDNTPLFQWLHVSENSLPVAYWIQIDNDQTFNEPYIFSFGWILDNELPIENSLPDGVYYWRIRARDNAGNLGAWSSASFRVDTQAPPAPVLSAPVGGAWTSIRPVLSWQGVQDPSSVQYKVYVCEKPSFNIPYRVYESDWLTENSWQAPLLEEALGLEGKFFYWKVCARDGAGNVGENSPTENFRVDNYVAKVTLLSPENGSLVSGTVRFEWYSVTDASGISGYWFQLSTSEEFTYLLENVEVEENWHMSSLYLPGNYYWRVCAIDNVGNRGPWSDCFTVRVSGWVSLESWESRVVAGGWWRKIEGLQSGTAMEAWRQIESMQGRTVAIANWRQVEKVSSGAQTERGWRWLESRFLRALSRAGWISIEVESTSLETPAAPVPIMVPLGAWGLIEKWEGKALVPSRWLEVDRSTASTLPIVLSISPGRASVEQGGTVYAIIRVESRYTSPVRLETDILPGATIALSPSEGVPAFQSVLRVEVGVSVQVGTYELGIYARTDSITVRRAFVLEVRPPTRSAPFVAAGTSGRFDFSDLRTPINRVEVEAIENVTEPYLTIEFLKQLPPGLPAPELPVYVYARVRTNVPNRSTRFSFTVEESWLRMQGAGAKLVCMLRLGERWEEISARFTGENAGGKMYEVTVPRLSEVTMLAIACRRPVRVPLASIVLALALGAGIGLGGWFLLHLLRPKPSFRPPREVLERVRRTMELGPAMPPQRVILERYKKAVVYKKKPKFRTVEGMAETSKVKELWEKVSRQVRPEVPRPEERIERPEGEKGVTHPKKPRPTIEELWERVSQQVRKREPIKKVVAYKRRPRMVKMAEPREIAEELWRKVSRRIRKK
jgi:PGF-pre-PGF domain-containing protein